MRVLTLCADDYGLTPGVSQAIRELITLGRLHATGCMTISPHWPEQAPLLLPLADRAQIGLHLTLTDQNPLGPMPHLAPHGKFPPLGRLLLLSLTGGLKRDEIYAELSRQIDAFQTHFGRLPAFLDGHHHIHQLPVIGSVVLQLWQERLGGAAWIRSCHDSLPRIIARGITPLRAIIISSLGLAFQRQLRRSNIPHNRVFQGVYDFSNHVSFANRFRRFADFCPSSCLMMVHPGYVDAELRAMDSLTDQRERELAYLQSDQCVFDLLERGITLRAITP